MTMAISECDLLDAWERSGGEGPLRRSLALLCACSPDLTDSSARELQLAERDRRLVALRSQLFGDSAECCTDCAACGEQIEFVVTASELTSVRVPQAVDPLVLGDLRVTCRLPTCADVLRAIELAAGQPEDALMAACVVEVVDGDEVIDVDSLAAPTRDAIAGHLWEVDDQTLTEVTYTCPSCGAASAAPFDITSYLLSELDDWANGVLAEVHELAWAYGWTEHDILALSGWRRRRYLEMVQ